MLHMILIEQKWTVTLSVHNAPSESVFTSLLFDTGPGPSGFLVLSFWASMCRLFSVYTVLSFLLGKGGGQAEHAVREGGKFNTPLVISSSGEGRKGGGKVWTYAAKY